MASVMTSKRVSYPSFELAIWLYIIVKLIRNERILLVTKALELVLWIGGE